MMLFARALLVVVAALHVGCSSVGGAAQNQLTLEHISPVIEMTRRCIGRNCPDYRVEVFLDGTVRYTGIHAVAEAGVRTSTIPLRDVNDLVYLFRSLRFFDKDDDYPTPPGLSANFRLVSLTFRDRGVEKTIKFNDRNVPPGFYELVRAVDGATNVKQWVCPVPQTHPGKLVCPF